MAEAPDDGTRGLRLRQATTARVALGRAGSALPTAAALAFQLAHARARDAVHAAIEPGEFGTQIAGHPLIEVHSQAPDRATYLMRPDLGRRLAEPGRAALAGHATQLAIVLADGLSATALQAHGRAVAEAIIGAANRWTIGPVVVAHQARVALGDAIGEALGADLVVMLIGERPGLSAADSLSAYLTWQPAIGRRDAERSCISNIRPPHGWSIAAAAAEVLRIAGQARLLRCTGVTMLSAAKALAAPGGDPSDAATS